MCPSRQEAGQRTPQEAGGGCPLTLPARTLLSHRLACQGSLTDLSRLPATVPGAPSCRHPASERRKPHRGRRGVEAGGRRGQQASATPSMRPPPPRPAQALFYGMYCMPPTKYPIHRSPRNPPPVAHSTGLSTAFLLPDSRNQMPLGGESYK